MPSYLETLPLHAITEVYGEAGLRDRFAREIERFPDHRILDRALALASDLHRHDRRVREPAVNHLLRVALRIMIHYKVRDIDIIAAALLHDCVEDHPVELAGTPDHEPALARLSAEFTPRVADLVRAVTNPSWRHTHEEYREHVAASLHRNPAARVIKLSDFTDNGVGLIHTTGPKVRKLAAKYRPLIPVHRELVQRPDTPLSDQVKRHILDQLARAEQRFAAILQTT